MLRWLSGQGEVRTFNVEGTRFERSFCAHCGSALPTAKANGSVVVPAGCLDSPVKAAPDAHIFMGSKADWDDGLESLRQFEGLPL